MPSQQAKKAQRDDVVIIIESLVALLLVIAGTAFFAWSVAADNVQVANTATQVTAPAY